MLDFNDNFFGVMTVNNEFYVVPVKMRMDEIKQNSMYITITIYLEKIDKPLPSNNMTAKSINIYVFDDNELIQVLLCEDIPLKTSIINIKTVINLTNEQN